MLALCVLVEWVGTGGGGVGGVRGETHNLANCARLLLLVDNFRILRRKPDANNKRHARTARAMVHCVVAGASCAANMMMDIITPCSAHGTHGGVSSVYYREHQRGGIENRRTVGIAHLRGFASLEYILYRIHINVLKFVLDYI